MTDETSVALATEALESVKCRATFSECYTEAVRNVAAAIKAAAEQAEVDALSFKTVEVAAISFGEMF